MVVLELSFSSIKDQLALEKQLLHFDQRNFCLISRCIEPAIVVGISGVESSLIHLEELPSSLPIVRRFSGGGTVVIDEDTLFVTFICNKSFHPFPAYPEMILRWEASIIVPTIAGLELVDNDFVIGDKKYGGNALYITKDRWLVHTSFLWSYDLNKMELLKLPEKRPAYRKERAHKDFLGSLSEIFQDRAEWIQLIKQSLSSQYRTVFSSLKEVQESVQPINGNGFTHDQNLQRE